MVESGAFPPPSGEDLVPLSDKVATVGVVALASIVGMAMVGGGGALIWFGIHQMINFEPQNVTVGNPFNPRTPDDEQRMSNFIDSVLLIVLGMGLVLPVLAGVREVIRHRPR
ncbi:hypothetical protein [Saccharopolyspora sp. 5N708]|uniref:hypothetical protein n=1 Tax=Saccharopolyspora sp. 5N708 TaxID=3457424 RepID=UPI003FCF2083